MQDIEQLTGDAGQEILNASVAQHDPLCVGAGHAQEMKILADFGRQVQRADRLRFLAAHHIGSDKAVAAGEARRDGDGLSARDSKRNAPEKIFSSARGAGR